MKRSDAPQVQKVELLCTRITRLCTSNPSICAQAIQGLSDFILSLEVSLKQQITPPSQPSSSQSTRSRAASTGAKPTITRRESGTSVYDTNYKNSNNQNSANNTNTTNNQSNFMDNTETNMSTKGRHPSPSPVPSHQTTENHPLRNNRRLESTTPPSHHDLSPSFYQPQSSKPSIAPIVEPESPESIQREFESFTVQEKKTGSVLVSDLEDPESDSVMNFSNTRNTPATPSTPLSGVGSGNSIARRRSMRIFDSDENEQFEANEKRMLMKRGLDEQIQEKRRLADMHPATHSRATLPIPSIPSTPSTPPTPPNPSMTSLRFPPPLQLPPSPQSAPASQPITPPPNNLLYRTTSSLDTETPSTPTYSSVSTPQYGRFKYSQATPEEKEALNKKFQQQRELQRNLQLQMEEKKRGQTQNSFGNTW